MVRKNLKGNLILLFGPPDLVVELGVVQRQGDEGGELGDQLHILLGREVDTMSRWQLVELLNLDIDTFRKLLPRNAFFASTLQYCSFRKGRFNLLVTGQWLHRSKTVESFKLNNVNCPWHNMVLMSRKPPKVESIDVKGTLIGRQTDRRR